MKTKQSNWGNAYKNAKIQSRMLKNSLITSTIYLRESSKVVQKVVKKFQLDSTSSTTKISACGAATIDWTNAIRNTGKNRNKGLQIVINEANL